LVVVYAGNIRTRDVAGHRRDVDDVSAAPAPHHRRHEVVDAVYDAEQIDVDDPVPVFEAGFEQAAAESDARVVHQHVDGIDARVHGVRERLHLLRARDVDAAAQHIDAEFARPGFGLRETAFVDVAEREVGAAAREGERAGAPDAAAGAGDEGSAIASS
jgi:hypothetical protein